jgi:hypothetical protein
VTVHLLMMGSLFWGYLDPIFSDSSIHPRGVDFFSVYEGGRNALAGRSVYFFDAQDLSHTPYHYNYRYVPGFAYVFAAPLNALPAWQAYWTWVSLYEALLVVCAYVTYRVADRSIWGIVGAAMWFAFSPFYLEQFLGQFSFFGATFLLFAGIGVARGREQGAGAAWIVSLVPKASSAVLAPLFVRLRWWRSLVVATIAGGLAMGYFLWRPGDFHDFWEGNVSNVFRDTHVRFVHYHPGDLGGVALLRNSILAFDKSATGVPAILPALLVATVVLLSLAATFFARRIDPLAMFAIWVCVFFLSYDAWEHHYVMLLPVLALLVALRPAARPWALAVFALLAVPTPYWLLDHVWNTAPLPPADALVSHQDVWPAWGVVLDHASKVVPTLVLWGYLVVGQLRSGMAMPAWQS